MTIATCQSCGERFHRDVGEHWKRLCLSCWIATQPPRTKPAPAVDPLRDELREQMRGLLSLCHPDRHGNSTLSTNITRWLLELRDRLQPRGER